MEARGARRNHAPETASIAAAVIDYVAELDALDLGGCPPEFGRALRTHRDAWAAMVPFLEAFPDERGEMHAVLDRLEARGGKVAAELEGLLAEVWSTWYAVEDAARSAGGPLAGSGD